MTAFWHNLPTDSHRVLALAGVNVSLQGFGMFITKITPYLSAGVYLVQIIVGIVTILHVLKSYKNRDKTSDES
jgi:hypothetical protein